MQGVLFILVILLLSGLIAYVGDRLGHVIGKKRLSWLNLRPRHTAIVFTVLTGLAISAVTLGLLLTLNQSLADGLFNYGQRVAEFEEQIGQLDTSYKLLQAQRVAIEDRLLAVRQDLAQAQVQREEAQAKLTELTQQRDRLLAQRRETEAKLTEVNRQLSATQQSLEAESQKLASIQAEALAAQAQIKELAAERKSLQQSLETAETERAAARVAVVELQTQTDELQAQKKDLQTEIGSLFTQAVQLRRGEVAIVSGELLAARVIPGGLPSDQLRLAVNNVLTVAEARARQLGAQPAGDGDRAVQITVSAVSRLAQAVQPPGSWLVQVLSITNRLKGEPVPAIAEVKPNRLLFAQNTTLVETNVLPGQTEVELEQSILRLLARANQKSRDAGILVDPVSGAVGEFSQAKLFEMVQLLRTIAQPTQVEVIAATDIYTAGPLQVNLQAELPVGSDRASVAEEREF
ncbi:MAG: DUF3084 domain-containing protein [Cyanobacteria bacterium P01_D01_bin.123]